VHHHVRQKQGGLAKKKGGPHEGGQNDCPPQGLSFALLCTHAASPHSFSESKYHLLAPLSQDPLAGCQEIAAQFGIKAPTSIEAFLEKGLSTADAEVKKHHFYPFPPAAATF
jgi:hypothetical protein